MATASDIGMSRPNGNSRTKQNTRRACDRCYSMKEKCVVSAALDSCIRCTKVQRPCKTDRPVRAAGRRSRARRTIETQSPLLSEASIISEHLPHMDQSLPGDARIEAIIESGALEPYEEQLIRMLQPDREADLREFSSILVTTPKFEQNLILRLRHILDWNIDGHIDGYLACMGALALKLGFIEDDDAKSDTNIRRGAMAVSKLRASPGPQSSKELDNWITFGLVIMTFAMTALGTGASTVRQHILKHVASQPLLPPEIQFSDTFIPLLVYETWECLLKRSVPLFQLEIDRQSPPVDRLFGLCTPLLPHFYRMCELSRQLANMESNDHAELWPAISRIRKQLEQWQIQPPSGFLEDFTTTEVIHLLCQAEVHRKGALLFLHRLQYPFGQEDESADCKARDILNELNRAQLVTGARVYSVAFPFFLAGVNARGTDMRAQIRARLDQHMDPTCPLISKQCDASLTALWQIRDVSTGFFWLDLIKHLPEVTMPL